MMVEERDDALSTRPICGPDRATPRPNCGVPRWSCGGGEHIVDRPGAAKTWYCKFRPRWSPLRQGSVDALDLTSRVPLLDVQVEADESERQLQRCGVNVRVLSCECIDSVLVEKVRAAVLECVGPERGSLSGRRGHRCRGAMG